MGGWGQRHTLNNSATLVYVPYPWHTHYQGEERAAQAEAVVAEGHSTARTSLLAGLVANGLDLEAQVSRPALLFSRLS